MKTLTSGCLGLGGGPRGSIKLGIEDCSNSFERTPVRSSASAVNRNLSLITIWELSSLRDTLQTWMDSTAVMDEPPTAELEVLVEGCSGGSRGCGHGLGPVRIVVRVVAMVMVMIMVGVRVIVIVRDGGQGQSYWLWTCGCDWGSTTEWKTSAKPTCWRLFASHVVR